MANAQSSMFPSAPIAGARTNFPDSNINIDYFITEENDVCVMHDRPFSKTLSWIEFDLSTSRLEIIMEDGDIRDYGMAVNPKLKPYFQNTHTVHVVLLNPPDENEDYSVSLPLIIHRP